MPRRKWLHKLGCETSPKPRCLLYWCCWLKKPVPNCTSALQHRWSGALDSRECCWGKPLVKGRRRVSLAQFCSVCMVLTSFGSPDLPISSHFASCHRAELEREPRISASSRVWFVWGVAAHRKLQGYTRRNKILAQFLCLFCFLKMRADRSEFVSKQSCHTVRF